VYVLEMLGENLILLINFFFFGIGVTEHSPLYIPFGIMIFILCILRRKEYSISEELHNICESG
jgi:hypothetical protein